MPNLSNKTDQPIYLNVPGPDGPSGLKLPARQTVEAGEEVLSSPELGFCIARGEIVVSESAVAEGEQPEHDGETGPENGG
jgi:hypothetical protein